MKLFFFIIKVARQNEVQTLEEQIQFLKAVHEQEVSELNRLQTIVGFDPAQFYRNELERAIRDIRGDFEQLNHEQKRELEEWYKIKTEEVEREVHEERERVRMQQTGISTEDAATLRQSVTDSSREFALLQTRYMELSSRLRELEEHLEHQKSENLIAVSEREREISILREKISELMSTYDDLLGRKTSLEFEINTYRRLLECEETRIRTASEVSSGFYQYQARSSGVSAVSSTPRTARGSSVEQTTETVMKRMQVQRTSKGPVGIKEISPDAKFLIVENTGRRGDIDISKWQIRRIVDNEPEIVFSFPVNTIISSGNSIKIWGRGQGKPNPPNEYTHEFDWKTGETMQTKLFSESGEERAVYIQKASA